MCLWGVGRENRKIAGLQKNGEKQGGGVTRKFMGEALSRALHLKERNKGAQRGGVVLKKKGR